MRRIRLVLITIGGGLDGPLRDLPPEQDGTGQAGARTEIHQMREEG